MIRTKIRFLAIPHIKISSKFVKYSKIKSITLKHLGEAPSCLSVQSFQIERIITRTLWVCSDDGLINKHKAVKWTGI